MPLLNTPSIACAEWSFANEPKSGSSPCFPRAAEGTLVVAAKKSTIRWTSRNHVRIPAKIRALLYRGDSFQSVLICNVSMGGAGLQGCNCLVDNDKIVLRLLNGRGIEATVRWWLGGSCGVQFSVALKPDDPLLAGKLDYFDGR